MRRFLFLPMLFFAPIVFGQALGTNRVDAATYLNDIKIEL